MSDRFDPSAHFLACSLILATLLAIAVFVPSPLVQAQASPGISEGHWAHYTVAGSLAPDTVDSLFTVTRVDGANITFTVTDTYSDGSNTTQTIWVDISRGPGEPSSGYYFLVEPGKTVGVSVYPGDSSYHNLTITDLMSQNYALSNRRVAHVQALGSAISLNDPYTPTSGSTEDFYWDNATGMFTEIVKKENGNVVLHVTMSSTNMWNADNPFDALIVPSAIVTITTAAVIGILVFGFYRKKRGRIARSMGR